MKDVDTFYSHLVYFTAIWSILWPIGIFYRLLVYFFPFWYVVQKKPGNPGLSKDDLKQQTIKIEAVPSLRPGANPTCTIFSY
jgi:hypothetical protein